MKKGKTKIVATLGPATSSYETIKKLINAGTSMFRLNTSHGTVDDHLGYLENIRKASSETGCYIPVMVDLQGPKIRVGNLPESVKIKKGQTVILQHGEYEKESDIIPVDYAGIAEDVKSGDKILLDDGKVGLRVTSVSDNIVYTEVIYGDEIRPRKGINLPGAQASLDAVTSRDKEFIKFAIEQNADYIALSFVRSAEDVKCARYYTKAYGDREIPIIAKIEKPQAVENLEEIVKAADAIMVARGDLGIEMSPQEVPIAQKKIIQLTNEHKKPCIVATQMLESMMDEPIPTRAEASDVANAIFDGTDAIMLSGETAAGEYPVEAVKMMATIARTVERSEFLKTDYDVDLISEFDPVSQAISNSAVNLSKKLKAKGILVFSEWGYTPPIISKLKPSVPIIVVTNSYTTARRLSLFWGIYTYVDKDCDSILDEALFKKIDNLLINRTWFKNGDNIIIVNSVPKLITGKINTIRVHKVGDTQ